MSFRALALICLLMVFSACAEIIYLPPASWFVFPALEVSDNSIEVQDYRDLIEGKENVLKELSIGILANPHRGEWNSRVDGDLLDERIDENLLLAEFLQDEDIFGEVVVVDSPMSTDQDFIITCSIDCLYEIELDQTMYLINCLTLGIGTLIGWPHHDSSAFYVAESITYDNQGETPTVITGTMAVNYKDWYCDNIYWRPDFYEDDALRPLFRQILYEFLANSGCLGL